MTWSLSGFNIALQLGQFISLTLIGLVILTVFLISIGFLSLAKKMITMATTMKIIPSIKRIESAYWAMMNRIPSPIRPAAAIYRIHFKAPLANNHVTPFNRNIHSKSDLFNLFLFAYYYIILQLVIF